MECSAAPFSPQVLTAGVVTATLWFPLACSTHPLHGPQKLSTAPHSWPIHCSTDSLQPQQRANTNVRAPLVQLAAGLLQQQPLQPRPPAATAATGGASPGVAARHR